MRSAYRKACRYAFVLDRYNYTDLVHDAYLYFYKKSGGQNLFEQHEGFILRCVKWMWWWRHKVSKPQVEYEDHFFNYSTPLQILESKEEVERIYDKIKSYHSGADRSLSPSVLLEFLGFLERGYEIQEIRQLMGISPQTAWNYRQKLKKIIFSMSVNNPFAGSKVKISKMITRKTYEANYKDYKYDPDLDCDRNEYFEIVTNGTDYILVRENKRD